MGKNLPSAVKYWSPSTRGFYDSGVHGHKIPLDVVEISNARWQELLAANSKGLDIVPDESGFPQTKPHGQTPEQLKAAFPFRRAVAIRRASEAIEKHRDEQGLGRATTLTTEQYLELIAHRIALRAATDELPDCPSFLTTTTP